MSWEVMQTKTGPCACGAGTETYVLEMDDWNRTRSATQIHCPGCRKKREQELAADQRREDRRDELLRRAQELAMERYSVQWLSLFAGMTKKAAWQRYTDGVGHPALGTFYQHIKHAGGLSKHLEWCLTSDLERCLRVLEINDAEIAELLKERAQLWKPTSGSM